MQKLDFKPISIKDRTIFDRFFKTNQPGISEFTFTNLFIWSKPRRLQFALHEEGLILRAFNKGADYFMPPLGFNDCQKTFQFLKEYGPENGVHLIKLIPEYQKKFAKKAGARLEPDRDDYDYLYKTESMVTLKGWRLDGKRGFIKKFHENYALEYKHYTAEYRKDCLRLSESWAEARKEVDPTVMDELHAIRELLDNFDKLGAVGGLIFVEGKLAAFSFGERLNDTTFVVHFEKVDPQFIGAYQMINQQFAEHEAAHHSLFINREQDMGIEGMRKAKLSYHPIRLIRKYTVRLA